MTNLPNPGDSPGPNRDRPENEQPPRSSSRWRRLRRIGIPAGVVTLAGVAGGAWWGWIFVNERLAPLVETNLSQTLKRPVKLGKVERVTLTSLRFGPSSIPATPTDPDRASVQSVDVAFNPLRILLTRNLNLDITLGKPDLYLEQAKDGTWISTQIQEQERQGPVKTELEAIRFRDANIVLVPTGKYGGRVAPVRLEQANGTAEFSDQNRRINYKLAAQSTTGGTVRLAGETLRNPSQTNLELRAQNFLVSEVDRLVKLPVDLQAGRANGNIRVELRPDQPRPFLKGTAQFQTVTLKVPRVPNAFSKATGAVQLDGTLIRLEPTNAFYGKVPAIASGDLDTQKGFNLSAKVKPTRIPVILETLKVPLPFPVTGEARADLKLTGAINKPILTGFAQNTKPSRIDRVDVSRFSGRFRLDAAASTLAISEIRATPAAGGQVTGAGQIALGDRPNLAFNFQAANVAADPILRSYLGSSAVPFSVGRVNGRALLSGPPTALVVTIPNAQVTPAVGGLVTASGRIALGGTRPQIGLNFRAVNVPGDAIARAYGGGNPLPITIGRVNAQGQATGSAFNPQLLVRWQAPEATYSGSGEIAIADRVITLRDTRLNVAGGSVTARAQATNGRWQAFVNGGGIRLNQFSRDLRGLFSGQFALSGSLSSFSPASIRAQGQARFSEGVSVVGQPLTAQVRWDGQKVIVQQATSPGLSAAGFLFAKLQGPGAPALTGLDLNVRTNRYSLQALKLPIPDSVQYSGQTTFSGRLTGTPTAPNIAGNLALYNFALNGVEFESPLTGTLRVAQGVALDVAGQRDRIAVTLDSTYQPIAFNIQQGEAYAIGRSQGGLLLVEARKFPLSILGGAGPTALLGVSGELNGDVAVDVRRRSVTGQLDIANPSVLGYRADQFGGRISFANGVATLTGAELKRGQSVFQINGSANILGADPQFKGQVKVANGRIQDVLELAQFFELSDLGLGGGSSYGSKDDLDTASIDVTETPVLTQLRRLAEIETLVAQVKARREASPLPELRELTGTFSGEVNAAGSLRTGINVGFNVEGDNWRWGPFYAKQVVAIGGFENGVLTLLPLRFQSDQSVIAFTGQLGKGQQSGQLRVENVPIENAAALVPLPLTVEGQLNATATIAGNFENPQVIGALSLSNGVLNGTEVQQAQGSFNYANARLNFGSSILLSGQDPISISGSIPRQLPFASVPPDSNQITLDINVKNEGLALLNLLTNQVAWVDGEGQVNVKVRGTLEQPIAAGTAEVKNATLRARALPDPLTGVNASILFEQDRLRVVNVQGEYGRGQISAQGVIPIFSRLTDSDPDKSTPLTVALQDVGLTLKGLYQGQVGGNVTVVGTALNPVIGGRIDLSQGQVLLSAAQEQAASNQDDGGSASGAPTPGGQPAQGDSNIQFSDLLLRLRDRVRVTLPPILNFVASGDLIINGSLDDLRPKGEISLRSGQVNLFTTQFNLARGYPQTAIFEPNRGLDPVLDVRLIASVPEVTRYRQPTSILSSEILDTPTTASSFGGFQTVRVQARVQGPASQLSENLELTSSPSRSESEIVALIGGGFVNTLGRGDSALGIANLAGSALLTNVQTAIGNILGLSEFRLFPTLTREDEARDSGGDGGSALGLAAEAAIDITPALSFSALRILTSNQPTQFGLRYRINDELLLRGSTDFSGDSRAVIEYESRF